MSGDGASSWVPWALGSAACAALSAVLAKAGVRDVDADYATLVRTLVVAGLLGAFVLATGRWTDPRALPPRALGLLALSALATGASWVCYFRALARGDASRVAPVDKLSVVLVAVFAAAYLGERPGARGWLGIGLVTLGVALIARR